nr:putative reverse transcriptase domain-containing protein [Tanacetum cinerariifolium]
MPELMRDALYARIRMEHIDGDRVVVFTGRASEEEMEFLSFPRYWSKSERMIPEKGDLCNYWRDISTDEDFLGPPPSYTLIKDLVLKLCHRIMAQSIAEILRLGYPQDLLDRKAMRKELLRRLRWHHEVVMRMRRCLRLCDHHLGLRKCLADENLVIPLEEVQLDDKLHFIEEPAEIIGREVKQLKQSRIPIVKVRWNSRNGPEYTWEREDLFKRNYPHL